MATSDEQPLVLVTRDGAVALVELNRPDRLNAMTKDLVRALLVELETLAADTDVRCVVLTGAGRGFCAGGDLQQIDEITRGIDVANETAELTELHRVSVLLHEMGKPTLAAVNGPCAGAGLSWACAADLRIAGERAVFKHAFAGAGLTGDFGSSWTLPRILGTAKARELALLDPTIDALEALRIGLVSEVVPDEELRSRALEVAHRLADRAPLALAGLKANLNDADLLSFADLLDVEAGRQAAASATEDCAEAAHAFLEKRDPVFRGR